jgi:hypothetical protein
MQAGETMNIGNLPDYWRTIAEEFSAIERLPTLTSGRLLSARAFDESQPAGPRTYMAATRYLKVARDNHEALLALLRHRGVTLWAPWSLLRPTFETAFLAAWILDPEDGRARRARGLRSEVLDFYEQRKHRVPFKAFPEVRDIIEESERRAEAGSLATYRAEAAALGQPFDRMHQRIVVVNELTSLSFVRRQPEFAPFLEGTWRQLSGFEHGFGWALLASSDRTVEAAVPGGVNVRLVIKDDAFVNAAKSTYFLLLSACRLLKRRHLEAAQQ